MTDPFGVNWHGTVDIEELLLSRLGWDLEEGNAADLLGGRHVCGLCMTDLNRTGEWTSCRDWIGFCKYV